MNDGELPALFQAADAHAINCQQRFFALQRVELVALVATAVLFELSWIAGAFNLPALAGSLLLALAIGARLLNQTRGLETSWTTSRVAAESIKSLAWQFAVGGGRFPSSMPTAEAKDHVVGLMGTFADQLESVPPAAADANQVTPEMEALRLKDFGSRQATYLQHRVNDQQHWYSTKADRFRLQARWWSGGVVSLEVVVLMMALARGVRIFDFDWAGILGACAAAAVAWRQTRQFSNLADSYARTSHELAGARSLVEASDASSWTSAVQKTELLMAQEQQRWRIDRGPK